MKVKLATQLLSQSVALKFCKNNLELIEFSDCGGTIKFIEIFNTVFDILNSRSISCFSFKKVLCKENVKDISGFFNEINTCLH